MSAVNKLRHNLHLLHLEALVAVHTLLGQCRSDRLLHFDLGHQLSWILRAQTPFQSVGSVQVEDAVRLRRATLSKRRRSSLLWFRKPDPCATRSVRLRLLHWTSARVSGHTKRWGIKSFARLRTWSSPSRWSSSSPSPCLPRPHHHRGQPFHAVKGLSLFAEELGMISLTQMWTLARPYLFGQLFLCRKRRDGYSFCAASAAILITPRDFMSSVASAVLYHPPALLAARDAGMLRQPRSGLSIIGRIHYDNFSFLWDVDAVRVLCARGSDHRRSLAGGHVRLAGECLHLMLEDVLEVVLGLILLPVVKVPGRVLKVVSDRRGNFCNTGFLSQLSDSLDLDVLEVHVQLSVPLFLCRDILDVPKRFQRPHRPNLCDAMVFSIWITWKILFFSVAPWHGSRKTLHLHMRKCAWPRKKTRCIQWHPLLVESPTVELLQDRTVGDVASPPAEVSDDRTETKDGTLRGP